MFSYIYSEGKYHGIQHFVAAKTQAAINSLAIDNVRAMAEDVKASIGDAKKGVPVELQAVYDAINSNDPKLAMKAWDKFIDDTRSVSFHGIQPIEFND